MDRARAGARRGQIRRSARAELGGATDLLFEVVALLVARRAVDASSVLRGEHAGELALDEAMPLVVRSGPSPRARDDVVGHLHGERERRDAERDLTRRAQRALPRAHRACDEPRHPRVALQLGDLVGVARFDLDLGHETRDRRQRDAGLAERREDLLDVAQEERVRSDDEHALALEGEAVRVEEVRGAVQRDGGLAGARTALDEQEARAAASG